MRGGEGGGEEKKKVVNMITVIAGFGCCGLFERRGRRNGRILFKNTSRLTTTTTTQSSSFHLHLGWIVSVPSHDVTQLELSTQLAVFSKHGQRIRSVDCLLGKHFHFERLLLHFLGAK